MSSIPQFHYSRDWTNPADFPAHQNNEAQNRADLEEAKREWETYWNNVVLPALTGGGGGSGDSPGDDTAYLPLAGGTMTGALRLARPPQFETEATTKAYVDNLTQSIMTDGINTSAIRHDVDEIELLVQQVIDGVTKIGRILIGADQIRLEVLNSLGDEAFMQMFADQIMLSVSEPLAQGDRVTASITMKIFGKDVPVYGQILLNGNVDVSGQLSAEALYAKYGEISDLHVDYLDTSRRIARYLRGDTSPNNYIRAHDQILEFVTGSVSGEAQVRDPNGALLYWPMDISGLTSGEDGYPRYEGERIFTTTQPTEYPVMGYTYTEAVKRSIRFDSVDGIYSPIDVFGAGNASGSNQAFIVKTANAWDFTYTTSGNKILGIHMHNEGFVDIDGLRKTTGLDFSHFHEGYFTETVQGAAQPKEYRVSFDGNGVPTGITDESGNTLNITW